jgi:peptidoglycan-associated lipoprotein
VNVIMSRRILFLFAIVAALGCRHRVTNTPPAAAPPAAAAAAEAAPQPVEAPAADFKSNAPAAEASPRSEAAGLHDAFFDYDRSALREDAREALTRSAEWLRSHPQVAVVLEGHCDERGTEQYNLALGEHRAQTAREYLLSLGVDPSRISIVSYGEERPFDGGHDEDAWSKNRRAHFTAAQR